MASIAGVLARLAQLEDQLGAANAKIARLEGTVTALEHAGSGAADVQRGSAAAVPSASASVLPAAEKTQAVKRARSPYPAPSLRAATPPPPASSPSAAPSRSAAAATPPPPALPPAVKAEEAESEFESLLRHYTLDKVSIRAGEAQQVMATRGGFSRDRFAVRELCRLDLPCYRRQGYSAHLAHLLSSGQRPAAAALLRAIRQHELGGGGAAPEAGFFGRGRGAAPLVGLVGEEEVVVLEAARPVLVIQLDADDGVAALVAPAPVPEPAPMPVPVGQTNNARRRAIRRAMAQDPLPATLIIEHKRARPVSRYRDAMSDDD